MFIPRTYTVESVTSGHPDKVCDQISDAILDECLRQDPESRVAIEVFGGHSLLVMGGEITSKASVNYQEVALQTYRQIGYSDKLEVITNITHQSLDISQGVDRGGAGDQGIMYGYATNETPEFLPSGIVLVHKLTRGLEQLRVLETVPQLLPDGKTQVTITNGQVTTILVSAQNDGSLSNEELRETFITKLISPALGHNDRIEIFINPTGKFFLGGFAADSGLTGRKIMVDSYGGIIPHGGGGFSGKDPTKVDRSGAYMARFTAKNIVANGYAKECLVSVAYAIGRAEPLMLTAVNEQGDNLSSFVKRYFDFRPQAMIERLGLRRPIYQVTASYGHFGRNEFPWESLISL